jgi:fluoroacetyl-CoA thioesterase
MKPGLHVGAAFEGEPVHPLYSTSSLVHHMEWAARKTILPFLEPHEEGMGIHVDVHHTMMTPIGMKIKVRATVSEIRDTKIECEVEAFNWRGKLAKGVVVQSIVQKSWLEQKIREMKVVNGIVCEQVTK